MRITRRKPEIPELISVTEIGEPAPSTRWWWLRWVILGLLVAVFGYAGYRWGWTGVALAGICLFWAVVVIVWPTWVIIENRRRLREVGLLDPWPKRLLRLVVGIVLVLIGLVVMFLGLYPLAGLHFWLNPQEHLWLDLLLYVPCGIPGFLVVAIGIGIATASREPKPETDFWETVSHLGHLIPVVGILLMPFIAVGLALLYVVDKVRYHPIWDGPARNRK